MKALIRNIYNENGTLKKILIIEVNKTIDEEILKEFYYSKEELVEIEFVRLTK